MGQFNLGQTEWFKELQEEHFTRMSWRAFGGKAMHDVRAFQSMIVNYFDARRALRGPAEANSVLVVDANTELTLSVTLQCFQAVGWRGLEVFERVRNAKLIQFPSGNRPESYRTGCPRAARRNSVEDVLGSWVRKGLNHGNQWYTGIRYTVVQPNVPKPQDQRSRSTAGKSYSETDSGAFLM
jgi:hypothetical protein